MIYVVIAALVVAADGLMKGYIVGAIPEYGRMSFIPGIMSLTNHHNYAAAFSMFGGLQVPILILTGIFVALVIWALVTDRIPGTLPRLCAGMVLGGAVGNAVDRLTLGYVVDMFQTDFINFAIFNIADCFITVGGIVFCLCLIFGNVIPNDKLKRHDHHS